MPHCLPSTSGNQNTNKRTGFTNIDSSNSAFNSGRLSSGTCSFSQHFGGMYGSLVITNQILKKKKDGQCLTTFGNIWDAQC